VKVSLVRRGGWAATVHLRSPPAILDADALPQAEREELRRLVRAAFARRRQEGDAGRKAAGSYTITVQDNGREETLSVADADEEREPAAAALREWLEARLPRR
jgi:emfourin